MRTREKIFYSFAILEALTLINAIPTMIQVIKQSIIFAENQSLFLLVMGLFQIVLYLSFGLSSYLFFSRKKAAFLMYYILLIFRLLYFAMSFGFLLRLTFFIEGPIFEGILVGVVVVLEILRLVYTIRFHKGLSKE